MAEEETLDIFIDPICNISSKATASNHMENVDGSLYVKSIQVNTIPLKAALEKLILFLDSKKMCLLVAHNANWDAYVDELFTTSWNV